MAVRQNNCGRWTTWSLDFTVEGVIELERNFPVHVETLPQNPRAARVASAVAGFTKKGRNFIRGLLVGRFVSSAHEKYSQ